MHRLTRRADFLAAAKGARTGARNFLLQARDRHDGEPPRIGLTVTKKTGNAVERNRIRRRLRAAVRAVLPQAGRPGFDYVLVARRDALSADYRSLLDNLAGTLDKVHQNRR